MIRTPSCETASDLYIRSCQWLDREPLFVDAAERISGAQALGQSLRFAQGLTAMGAGAQSVVAFLCKCSARHAAAWFAGPLSGRISCNLHVRETPQRLGEALAWLEAAVLVHDADLDALAEAAVAASGRAISRVSLGARGGADASFTELVEASEAFDVLAHRPSPDALGAIILSSGTTGRPKGVMHTQRTLLENAKAGQHGFGCLTPHDAVLILMQPSFAAWPIFALPALGGKAKICFRDEFKPAAFLAAIEQERITIAPLVPTMWRMVFAEDASRYDLSSLKLAVVGGEPPSASDLARMRAICPGVACTYVASESFMAGSVVAFTDDLVRRGKVGAAGRPAVGADVKIIDPAGGFADEVAMGEIGEIAVSGSSLAAGYWKDAELTRKRFDNGWWRSGDLGRLDADGYLWVLGRTDNVINTGGIKVSAEEIELALMKHPQIAQCAVIGRPDERFGQRIEAFIVARGAPPDVEELGSFLREKAELAAFKAPKAFHVVDALPTGPTGKLYRRALLET